MGVFQPNIEKMKAKGDVKGLIKSLKHKDAVVRKWVAQALGETKDIRAVEPLIQTCNDKDEDVRWEATKALEKIRDGRDVDALIHEALGIREVSKKKIKMKKVKLICAYCESEKITRVTKREICKNYGIIWRKCKVCGKMFKSQILLPSLFK